MVERIQQQQIAALERQANQAVIEMAWIAGDPELLAVGLAEGEALAHKTTNVNVANSIVGAINTGTVRTLTVQMKRLSQDAGTADLAKAFEELTSAIVSSSALPAGSKNEATEQLTFLADQASVAEQHRQGALIRPILQTLQTTLSTTADLLAVWNQWGPALLAFFRS